MIEFIEEINRLLWSCVTLGPQKASIDAVSRLCSSRVIRGRLPNHQKTIEFCEQLGLIQSEKGFIMLTPLGQVFWEANPNHTYELTDEQKDLFITRFLLTNEFREELRELLVPFSIDYETNTLFKSEVDDLPIFGDTRMLETLKQLGVIHDIGNGLRVDAQYARKLLASTADTLTLPELREILARQERIGDLAEQIAITHERGRLKSLGCDEEARLVRRVSGLNVCAGYDIESFDGKSQSMIHDRFIEVKGSTKDRIDFYWSKNEMEKARHLGRRYWLYFIGGINADLGTTNCVPILIQDPFVSLNSGGLTVECELRHVTNAVSQGKPMMVRHGLKEDEVF